MKYQTRLEEVARWHDWHKDTITDVVKRQQYTLQLMENFFDLFALISNELRELKGNQVALERPYWQSGHIPTFVEKKPIDPDDPD